MFYFFYSNTHVCMHIQSKCSSSLKEPKNPPAHPKKSLFIYLFYRVGTATSFSIIIQNEFLHRSRDTWAKKYNTGPHGHGVFFEFCTVVPRVDCQTNIPNREKILTRVQHFFQFERLFDEYTPGQACLTVTSE